MWQNAGMRRGIMGVWVALAACGGVIEGQQPGGLPSCSSKLCPNDPEITQPQMDSCNASRVKLDMCKSQCNAYMSCLAMHIRGVCGADGKTDPAKAAELVTRTCPLDQTCVMCVSK
jgi:hypothetical protein